MESMCFIQNLTWQLQQCVRIHHQNMHDHIGHVFCVVVQNSQVLIFHFYNHIITIKMLSQSYFFVRINT